MTTHAADVRAATEVVRRDIRSRGGPDAWYRGRHMSGERVYTHYDDGDYAATVNFGVAWCDYEVVDRLNDALAAADLPFDVVYLSDYEVGLERV